MQQLIDVDPADPEPRLELASIYRAAGDVDKALLEAKTALESLEAVPLRHEQQALVDEEDEDVAAAVFAEIEDARALAASLVRELTAAKQGREPSPA